MATTENRGAGEADIMPPCQRFKGAMMPDVVRFSGYSQVQRMNSIDGVVGVPGEPFTTRLHQAPSPLSIRSLTACPKRSCFMIAAHRRPARIYGHSPTAGGRFDHKWPCNVCGTDTQLQR
jgi:hypothetical protein